MPAIDTLPTDWRAKSGHLAAVIAEKGRQAAIAGRAHEALDYFAQALTIEPKNVCALVGSGAAAAECKNWDDSRKYTFAALDAGLNDRDAAVCWNNLGFTHYVRREYAQALECMDKSIALDRYYKMPVVTKGAVLVLLDRIPEAYALFERANLMNPTDWEPIVNRGILNLLRGNWELGLPGYEHRKMQGEAADLVWPVPRWNGEPLNGRSVLIWPDQGLGDCIWTHRLVAEVAKQGKVYLQIYPLLEGVLPVPDGVTFVRAGESIPDLHFHVPLMSLPYCLRVDPQNPPAPSLDRGYWPGPEGALKPDIGLCWSGNINHKLDDLRSIPLWQMLTLKAFSRLPQARFYALQHEVRQSDKAAFDASNLCNEPPKSFKELAELINTLDLVITVDTAVLHLAAEMGVPTWGLIPFAPDFRWGTAGAECPWYPSLTLYRNRSPLGGWDEVIERVAVDLREKFA